MSREGKAQRKRQMHAQKKKKRLKKNILTKGKTREKE